MDATIPVPVRDVDKPFMMSIESTFTIAGRGTVVTGTIESGVVKVREEIDVVGYNKDPIRTAVIGIETFRK
jgi:elongation factor Tu